MTETIAGDKKKAKKYLKQFLSEAERQSAIESASDSMLPIVKSLLS
jgi:hypothetical protein